VYIKDLIYDTKKHQTIYTFPWRKLIES